MSWGQGEQRTGTLLPTTECLVAASDRWKRPRDAERDEGQGRTRMGFKSQVLGSGNPPHSPVGPWTSDRRTLTSQSSPLESGARPRSDRKGTDGEPRTQAGFSVSFVTGKKKATGSSEESFWCRTVKTAPKGGTSASAPLSGGPTPRGRAERACARVQGAPRARAARAPRSPRRRSRTDGGSHAAGAPGAS